MAGGLSNIDGTGTEGGEDGGDGGDGETLTRSNGVTETNGVRVFLD